MPLRGGESYEPNLIPPPLHATQKVWVCRFTGALFSSYEEYLKKLASYRQRVWSCKHTGKGELSYEEALTSEARCQGLLDQFPDCYEEPVTRLLHHATLKLEDLCQKVVSYFKDRFVPGEEVIGFRESVERACRILSAVDPVDVEQDSQALSTAVAILPPDPDDEYRIEWISDGAPGVLKRSELMRKRVPLTRAVIKSWLPLAAEAETVTGVKGVPCIWRANTQLCQRYGLAQEIPASLKERIERAQQRREQQTKRVARQEQEPYLDDNYDDPEYDEEDSQGGRATDRKQDKQTVPVESLEATKSRLAPGTVKRVLFDALHAAGDKGMTIPALVDAVQAAGVKTWDGSRSANSSVAATCTHDNAFLRIGPGQITLRAFKEDTMQINATGGGRAQSEDYVGNKSPQVERNSFKCPKCHKTTHPENSPLVLCDSCPRSYHLMCLDLTFEELPEDDWQCPKCTDRKSSTGRRLTSSYPRNDIYERLPLTESDKEDRGSLRGMSRAERERRRFEDRSDKERLRDENRFLREKARVAARWAALHPTDDLEMLDDEEEALAAADMEAQVAAEEVARAVRRAQAKPESSTLDDRLSKLQHRAKLAADRAAAQRLVIDGPPPVKPGVESDAAKTALYDCLAIVDFITIFGASFEAAPLTLLEVQQAAAYPLDTDHLQHLYVALLRCLLIEAMGMEGVVKSRAKRWGRVIDETTWPEILRRYLLASRAGLAVPEDLYDMDDKTDVAHMEDNTACILGAKLLSEMPYHRLNAGLHLRLLTTLCNDVCECTTLRNEISARVDEMQQLQAEFRQKQNEDRKRHKEEATKMTTAEEAALEAQPAPEGTQDLPECKTAEVAPEPDNEAEAGKAQAAATAADEPGRVEEEQREGQEDPQGEPAPAAQVVVEAPGDGADAEAKPVDADPNPPPSFELPEELKEYKGSKRDRKELQAWKAKRSEEMERLAKEKGAWDRQRKEQRRKRQKIAAEKKQAERVAADAQEKDYEEELKEREAALDDAMDARAVRGEALGQDRHFRRYWWFPGEQSVVFVEEPDGRAVGVLDAPEELEALVERLNHNGLREKVLLQNLLKRKDTILSTLGYNSVNLDYEQAPRPHPEKDVEVSAAEVDKVAVQVSIKRLCDFLDQLDSIPASPVNTSVADWKARLLGVQTRMELATAVLDLEADINELGSGLPTGADNASLAGFGKPRKSAARLQPDTAASEERDAEQGAIKEEPLLPNGPAEASQPIDDVPVLQPAQVKGDADVPPIAVPALTTKGESATTPLHANASNPPAATANVSSPPATVPPPVTTLDPPAAQPDMHQPSEANGVAAAEVLSPQDPPPVVQTLVPEHADAVLPNSLAGNVEHQEPQLPTPPRAPRREVHDQSQGDLKPPSSLEVHEAPPCGETVKAEPSPERFDATLSATASVERLFRDSDYVLPVDYIDPPEELDASDTEGSKSRRGGTLWRSARERKAWLKDSRRALTCQDASCAAYVAAVMVDRAQPLLRSLQRASKRMEKEAAEWEALEAAAAAAANPRSSTEGTPGPQLKVEKSGKATKSASKATKGPPSQPRTQKKSKTSQEPAGRMSARSSEGPPTKKARTSAKQVASVETGLEGATLAVADGAAPPRSDRWNANCETCGEKGDLLCCEAPDCPIAQHVACAGLDEVPTEDWYCAQHRNKPSLKRKRSRSATKDAPASARQSAEPTAPKKAIGGTKGAKTAKGKTPVAENGVEKKATTAAKKRKK